VYGERIKVFEMGKKQGNQIGRNASTGRFTPVSTARKHPKTHVVETIKR
jgi:hypothetical protein